MSFRKGCLRLDAELEGCLNASLMDEDQDQNEVAGVGQLPALVIEHGSSGRSAVHALGQASVGIGKYLVNLHRTPLFHHAMP